MKRIFIILLFLGLSVHAEVGQQFAFTGKVVYVPVEGGFYGIINAQGERFIANNLPDLLKQDGLSVTLQAMGAENTLGIHMWGQYIDLQNIAVTTCTRLPSK